MIGMHRDASTGPWLLEPARRHYAWGSTSLLPELLGEGTDGEPLAELWFGSHPAGSATLPARQGTSLAEAVRDEPDETLGALATRGDRSLPFMVKLIAAARPLSIQVHPDGDRAAAGFAAENERRLALDDPQRRYQDGAAKPEIVCALDDFDALIDFRPIADVAADLRGAGLDDLVATLEAGGLAGVVRKVLTSDAAAIERAIDALVTTGNDVAAMLVDSYPGDPGVVVATFLNHLHLSAGEAAFLAPGAVHAYLSGLALEVMASSDNVLRAGLTSKLVDVDEFLSVARLEPAPPDLLHVDDRGEYPVRADQFALVRHGAGHERTVIGPAVVVCTAGSLRLDGLAIRAGQGAFVGADATGSVLTGPGEGYLAVIGSVDPK